MIPIIFKLEDLSWGRGVEAEKVVEEGVRWAYSCRSMLYINTGVERISEVLAVNQVRADWQ